MDTTVEPERRADHGSNTVKAVWTAADVRGWRQDFGGKSVRRCDGTVVWGDKGVAVNDSQVCGLLSPQFVMPFLSMESTRKEHA